MNATMHKPLTGVPWARLRNALYQNVEKDVPIRMDSRDTSFIGVDDPSLLTDDGIDADVINAIAHTPVHY